jgi:hypothetical protein
MDKRLPRLQREALERQDAVYLKQPLLGSDIRSPAAHLRHMVKLLRNKRSLSPCSDAVMYLTSLFERTIAQEVSPQAQQMIACRKGCAHCCAQPVAVSAAEAFCVAREIRNRPELADPMRQAGEAIRAMPADQRLSAMRCPLLLEQACGAYAARPLACRLFVSFSLNACISHFVMLAPSNIQSPIEYGPVGNACRMILFASQGLIGRRDHTANFEMKAVVPAILALGEDAEARWLAGEDVLKDVDKLPPIKPVFGWDIDRMIAAVGPTL